MPRPAGRWSLAAPPPLPHQPGIPDQELVTWLAKLFRDEIRNGPRPDLIAINQLALLLNKDTSALKDPIDKARWVADLVNRTLANAERPYARSAPENGPLNQITHEILKQHFGIDYGKAGIEKALQNRRAKYSIRDELELRLSLSLPKG
jgi:hypothetical protein